MNLTQKRQVREAFSNNPLFLYIKEVYTPYNVESKTLRMSTEDVFQEVLALIDRRNEGRPQEMSYWEEVCDMLYCELRDLNEENKTSAIDPTETKRAVCIILVAVLVCMNTLKTFVAINICTTLMRVLNSKYPVLWLSVRDSFMLSDYDNYNKMRGWTAGYLNGESRLTDEEGCLVFDNGKEDKEVGYAEDSGETLYGSAYAWIAGKCIEEQQANVEIIKQYIRERIAAYKKNEKGKPKKGYKTDVMLDVRAKFYATSNKQQKLILKKPSVAEYNTLFGDVMKISGRILEKWQWV